jgi:magnesium-transporting ATPase (P-type)
MTFAGIVVAQAGNVLACRTSKQSIFKTSLKTNKWIIFGIASQIGILALIVYVPVMQRIFTTAPLNIGDWAFLISLALIVVFAEEIRKFFSRKFSKTGTESLKMHDHT